MLNTIIDSDMTKYITANYEPQIVLKYFEDICRIPHCSGNEKVLGDFIISLAKKQLLEVVQDAKGNILIRKPGTSGNENLPSFLMQGHMDMVCVKKDCCNLDMSSENIRLILENNLLRADGTSLGADNAVGLCNMLAVMTGDNFPHPPLEFLFTVEEETGFTGIRNFDMSKIKSRRMLTMDCGDPDTMVIGGAGSVKAYFSKECSMEILCGNPYKIAFYDLTGGHSGIEAGKNRASAIELIGRAIEYLSELQVNLVSIRTEKINGSIPRTAECIVMIRDENIEKSIDLMDKLHKDVCTEYQDTETDLKFEFSVAEVSEKMMLSSLDTKDIADFLLLMPYGVQKRSMDNLNWVMCSSLITSAECKDGYFTGKFSVRANMDELKYSVYKKVQKICELSRVKLEKYDDVPAWPMKRGSMLQKLCQDIYRGLFKQELTVEPIHGGVEAGIISLSIMDMDIVGLAPKSRGAHTVDEHLFLDTMEPFWRFLTELLKNMC